jgi:hypothetical protein
LPGRCENITNPTSPTSSGCNQTNEVHIHDFVIPTDKGPRGKVLDAEGKEYLVKWARQGVYYPTHSNPSACDAPLVKNNFSQADNLILPTVNSWNNPRIVMSNVPTTTGSAGPKYINGEAVR